MIRLSVQIVTLEPHGKDGFMQLLIRVSCKIKSLLSQSITKTRLFKYIENFTSKNIKFSDKKNPIFFIFLLKT